MIGQAAAAPGVVFVDVEGEHRRPGGNRQPDYLTLEDRERVLDPYFARAAYDVQQECERQMVRMAEYAYEKTGSGRMVVTRMRPALVVQGAAGSGLLRYGLPPFVPSSALALVKVVPLPPDLVIQAVHTPDVADGVARALERRAAGAFNLAADPPLTASRIAAALGAQLVPTPRPVLRGL